MILFKKCAVAFFFLFFLHGFSIGNGQQGISYNSLYCYTYICRDYLLNRKIKERKTFKSKNIVGQRVKDFKNKTCTLIKWK